MMSCILIFYLAVLSGQAPAADAEALYSFEGTRQINTLVVGRAITGMSAFV